MTAKLRKTLILLSIVAIIPMITIWTWTADLRKENHRLKETLQTVSQEVPLPREPTVIQVPTDDGRFAAETAAMNLRLKELSTLYPKIMAEIRNLDIKPERTVQVTNHYTENEKHITTLVRDTIIRDTVRVRVFDYEDGYYSVKGIAEADTQRVSITSRDTLMQVVFRGKREKPRRWIFSPRQLEQRVALKNPNAVVEYSQIIQLMDK
jgi:hypothetical protein